MVGVSWRQKWSVPNFIPNFIHERGQHSMRFDEQRPPPRLRLRQFCLDGKVGFVIEPLEG